MNTVSRGVCVDVCGACSVYVGSCGECVVEMVIVFGILLSIEIL